MEKNLGTLQKHLDEVIAKQLRDVKKAMAERIAKGIDEDPERYARARCSRSRSPRPTT